MELSRCLLDSLSQEGLSVKLTGKLARPSAQQLTAFLHQFRFEFTTCNVVYQSSREGGREGGSFVNCLSWLCSCNYHVVYGLP